MFPPEIDVMVEHKESPKMTLRLHAMVCSRARTELRRQWDELRQRSHQALPDWPRSRSPRSVASHPIEEAILRTLLYFDIWNHPLNLSEIHTFLPVSVSASASLMHPLGALVARGVVDNQGEHYMIRRPSGDGSRSRRAKERRAIVLWKMARVVAGIIKRFPFVRAVWVSGELSKNVASEHADIDFFIVTEPGRLWITRSMLILFKKVFLLNSRKFFCLNSFITTAHLESSARNIYQAIEIASLKPLYNAGLLHEYLRANAWVWSYFPNFDPDGPALSIASAKQSKLQSLIEGLFHLVDADALDNRLMVTMQEVWKKRYPELDDATRDRILRSTKHESRAYLGDFEARILEAYARNLREYHLVG